jgi:hypothetical protein
MSQIDLIVDQLERAFDGEAWHGPALMEILDGIDARTAAARPIPSAHSIWGTAIARRRLGARRHQTDPWRGPDIDE